MLHNEKDESIARWIEKLPTFIPVVAAISGGLFVLGLFVAFCIDSSLGVGNVEVSRERAVCLGIALSLVLLPTFSLWASFRESNHELESPEWRIRFSASMRSSAEAIFVAWLLTILGFVVGGKSVSVAIGISTLFPVVVACHLVTASKGNARRLVHGWPLFGIILAFIPLTMIGSWLPVQFGGHVGPRVTLVLKDGSELKGRLKVSDSKVVVVKTGTTIKAISRDDIRSIEAAEAPGTVAQ